MFELLCPDDQASSLDRIQVDHLVQRGIRGLMIDLDNTMTPWNDLEVGPKVTRWFKDVEKAGIRTCILSNNRSKQRVAAVADQLGIPFVYRASKPRERAYQAGMAVLKTDKRETAVIGDQLFTDVLGGKRAGYYTILVLPISKREFIGTRLIRRIERVILWLMKLCASPETSPRMR